MIFSNAVLTACGFFVVAVFSDTEFRNFLPVLATMHTLIIALTPEI